MSGKRYLNLVHDVLEAEDVPLDRGAFQIVTLAPWQIWLASQKNTFSGDIARADATTIDGTWLALILKLAGTPHALVTGRALVHRYYTDESFDSLVGVVGSSAQCLDILAATRPNWVTWGGLFGSEVGDARIAEMAQEIRQKQLSLIFVALGSPKQEQWGRALADAAGVCVIGVGGAVETAVGIRDIPPLWIQRLKLEWLQRTMQDPGRFLPRIFQALSVLPMLAGEAVVTRVRS
jgi:N-acetylglucosaminyldiphosphoundecaprenol N-acetyl-beta-D-mannosaminyltransferase